MLLFYSSFLFLSNAATTFYKKYFVYSFMFLCLTLTSLVFHSDPTPLKMRVDQCVVAAVLIYGGWLFYKKLPANPIWVAAVLFTFMLAVYLYTYGFYTQQYCFHPDKMVGNRYHCLVHVIASLGHNLIILF